jgi:hypothetical protein
MILLIETHSSLLKTSKRIKRANERKREREREIIKEKRARESNAVKVIISRKHITCVYTIYF